MRGNQIKDKDIANHSSLVYNVPPDPKCISYRNCRGVSVSQGMARTAPQVTDQP